MAWFRCGGNGKLVIPILMLARKGAVTYYDNAITANTGGTMFENHWHRLNIERFGVSTIDAIGYPTTTTTTISVKVIGFSGLEEDGTVILTAKENIVDLDISGFKYIKIVAEKSNTSGDTFSAVNVVFS